LAFEVRLLSSDKFVIVASGEKMECRKVEKSIAECIEFLHASAEEFHGVLLPSGQEALSAATLQSGLTDSFSNCEENVLKLNALLTFLNDYEFAARCARAHIRSLEAKVSQCVYCFSLLECRLTMFFPSINL
jgi:hypothetical protein